MITENRSTESYKMNIRKADILPQFILPIYGAILVYMSYVDSFPLRVRLFLSALFIFLFGIVLLQQIGKYYYLIIIFIIGIMFQMLFRKQGAVQTDVFNALYWSAHYWIFLCYGLFFIKQPPNYQLANFSFIIILIIIIISCVTTIVGLVKNPYISRLLATSGDFSEYYESNIGGFSFIYSIIFISPVLVLITFRNRNILSLLALFVIIITTIFSQYAIANLLNIAFIGAILILGSSFSAKQKRRRIIFFLIVIILLVLYIKSIGSLFLILGDNITHPRLGFLRYRILEFGHSLSDSTIVGGAYERFVRYSNSFNKFIRSPILGTSITTAKGLGGHSTFFDILGGTGILGWSFFYGIILSIIKAQIKAGIPKYYSLIIWGGFLILSMLNPIINATNIFTLTVFSTIGINCLRYHSIKSMY